MLYICSYVYFLLQGECGYVCVTTLIVLHCVLCLPLSIAQLSRLLPPGSIGKVRYPPTQQRVGMVGRGQQVDSLQLMKEQ
ncbi:hypothetical protein EXN66_Car014933 [Channa argus]|uniref:Uncharacterized protein n=1 Tax=Channa argus TaxID=215402 RepID=A0A6G1QAS1_CHAAH|nr:hypothetical protein EXN66_Car014933 [Channa argus]